MSDPVPTQEDIDKQLAFWEDQVARVKTNLDLLQQSPSYVQILSGLKFSGRTQDEVVTPILAARDLADQYEMLAGQVAKARLLRNSLGRFRRSPTTLTEIYDLLNKPTVPLPAAQVPLAQRNLLDDPRAQSHLTLEQLVKVMTQAFASARDAVTSYDAVMERLMPSLRTADQSLTALEARAAALGGEAAATVAPLRMVLQNTRQQVFDDPLGAQANFARTLQTRLEAVTQQLDAMEQARATVRDDLARAQARQARAERVRDLDPSQVAGLGEWLANIAHTVESGQFSAAKVGLERWNAAADGPYASEEQRQEQLSLLKALRAMAQSRRDRGVTIDASVDALALEAEAALRAYPADLNRGADLVQRYQRAITSL